MTPVTSAREPSRYNGSAMIDTVLIPESTVITSKGDGAAVDVSGAANRVLLVTLNISEAIEQEAIELSVFGSADGEAWPAKPIAALPQKFYTGQYPLLLDVSTQPEVKFLRAHWEVNRWGRGPETPKFTVGATLKEVPAELLRPSSQRS